MNHEAKDAKVPGHGDYERRDIGVAGILYFLLGLLVAGGIAHFIVQGVYHYLDNRYETRQPRVSPLIRNIPSDTRRIPPQYNGDYQKYLQDQFPAPQLEINERTELNDIRRREEDTLSTYGWVDQNAGTVHIPIDRAMDLLAQQGLPVRQSGSTGQQNKKGPKQ
ncbi:MAG TPA: hypothetical protein VF123_19630 [Candidatus Sulfotelmatobacter sp.]